MHKLKWMDGRRERGLFILFPVVASLDAGIDSESEGVAGGDFRGGWQSSRGWYLGRIDRVHCAMQTYFYFSTISGRDCKEGNTSRLIL